MPLFRLILIAVLFTISVPLAAQHECGFDHPTRTVREMEQRRHALLAKRAQFVAAESEHYDVYYYRLDVTFPSDASLQFHGSAHMVFRSVIDDLDAVVLNFGGGSIDSVLVGGERLDASAISRSGDVLTLDLPAPLQADETGAVTMYYRHPYGGSAVTITNVRNAELERDVLSISTQSEPYDARTWWPCKDDPADKADSVDIIFTVDEALYPVSNGLVVSDTDNGDGTRTVHWKSRYPIVTYLVSIAASEYNHREFSFTYDGKTMPVGSWWYGMPANDMAGYEQDMLDGLQVFSDLFGVYPFIDEKYGMAEYEWGGAMEHQTVSSMGFYSTGVVIHELIHQWFGDKVTCASFEHIWLNEGWATYGEALYYEALGGHEALKADMARKAIYGPGTIYVDNPENSGFGAIFSSLTYEKASWVLHMLRHVMGDEAFFRGAREYLGGGDMNAYRSVTTAEFQQFMEDASGLDLDYFFQQWIYGELYPTYRYEWNSIEQSGMHEVTVNIDQLYIPQRQVFTMPVDLYFRFPDGSDTTIVAWNDEESESYTYSFPVKPLSVQLDPENWILKQVIEIISNPTFDQGILVVNGVDWDVSAYTDDLKESFASEAFSGGLPYTLWDIFPDPDAGYPANVPEPIGSGSVPGSILGQYCTVVWLGNAYNGDDAAYLNSSLWEYVKAGGNLVLITRMGRSFVTEDMRQMLGIRWEQTFANAANCVARIPELTDMTFTGVQNLVSTFNPVLNRNENALLFAETASSAEERGLGVWGKPITTEYGESGHMMFVSLRPYRVEPSLLKQNMEKLLKILPCNPVTSAERPRVIPEGLSLAQTYPNPVTRGSETTLRFSVDAAPRQPLMLRVYDMLGRTVRTRQVEVGTGGFHSVPVSTAGLPAGVYTLTLRSAGLSASRKMIVID